jgi:hypothetical protein
VPEHDGQQRAVVGFLRVGFDRNVRRMPRIVALTPSLLVGGSKFAALCALRIAATRRWIVEDFRPPSASCAR